MIYFIKLKQNITIAKALVLAALLIGIGTLSFISFINSDFLRSYKYKPQSNQSSNPKSINFDIAGLRQDGKSDQHSRHSEVFTKDSSKKQEKAEPLTEVRYGIGNASYVYEDYGLSIPEPKGPIKAPSDWGKIDFVSGDLVELDDGTFLRRSLIHVERLDELVIGVEYLSKQGKVLQTEFYDATTVAVRTKPESHSESLEALEAIPWFIVSRTECYGDVIGGMIFMESPSSTHNIFNFPNQIRHVTKDKTKPMLIKIDI